MKRNFLLTIGLLGVTCSAAEQAAASVSSGNGTLEYSADETDPQCTSQGETNYSEKVTASAPKITPTFDLEEADMGLPDDWEPDWDIGEIWEDLECDDIMEAERPVHSQETWAMLRNTYRRIVGPENSSILPTNDKNGFYVPYKVTMAPGDKGRGVFSTSLIQKGTCVWTSHKHQSARFEDGHSYRRFLAAIPEDMACDVMNWAYVQDFGTEDEPNLMICADLDEGSFINSGQWDEDVNDNSNIGCIQELARKYTGGCQENWFALRDIQPGEEILVDYRNFAIRYGWEEFGL